MAVLVGMVACPFWLCWRDGTPAAGLTYYRQETAVPSAFRLRGADKRGREVTAVLGVALSPDGRFALAGDLEGGVALNRLDRNDSLQPFRGTTPRSWVGCVAFSADGRYGLSGGEDRRVILRHVTSRSLLREISTPGVVGCAAFTPDGSAIATGCNWPVFVELPKGGLPPSALDPAIRLWDVASGQQKQTLHGHRGPVRAVTFDSTGRRLLSASDDGTMRLWDVPSGLQMRILRRYLSPVLSAALSPDGTRAVSGHEDGSVRIWDLDNEEEAHRLERHRADVTAVAFAPDGRTAFTGSLDQTVRWWDVTAGRQLGVARGEEAVCGLVVASDGRRVLAGGYEGVIRLWEWPADGR